MVHTHRFIYTSRSGSQRGELFEFRDDAMAMVCARSLLSASTVAVAVRRIEPGGAMCPVGLWIWKHGEPEWRPGE